MLIKSIQERNGNVPTTTASTAAMDALKALRAKKISLATPYVEGLAKMQEEFLTANGFEVLHTTWIKERTTLANEISAKTVYELAKESNEVESEAIFISCANLQAIDIIEKIEEDLKKPVITSNQATMWRMLRLANINVQLQGYGQLFNL